MTIVGETFGRWVATHEPEPRGRTKFVRVRCQCGAAGFINFYSLRSGGSKSCGCLRREIAAAKMTKHGHAAGMRGGTGIGSTPEYRAWLNAKNRCYNSRYPQFAYYGGRGITMHATWRDSFAAFLSDMGPRPDRGSLDRIDSDGNYEPENCRWASPAEQSSNRRYCQIHEWEGEMLTVAEIARRTGKVRQTLMNRLAKGMTIQEAVSA